jgi:hypothetical protein
VDADPLDLGSYVAGGAGLVSCFALFVYLFVSDKGLLEMVSGVGATASMFGLVVAILQIIRVRTASEAAKQAAEDARSQMYNFISVSDVSRATGLLNEVQRLLRDKKFEAAEIRLTDLKKSLIQFRSHDKMIEMDDYDKYVNICREINVEIINLNKKIIDSAKSYDSMKLIEKLETVDRIISEFENKIKFN